jgi:hypothetical protein
MLRAGNETSSGLTTSASQTGRVPRIGAVAALPGCSLSVWRPARHPKRPWAGRWLGRESSATAQRRALRGNVRQWARVDGELGGVEHLDAGVLLPVEGGDGRRGGTGLTP